MNKEEKKQEVTDKLKDLYAKKSQSAKEMFKSMQSYLSDYIEEKAEDQKPVWDTVKETIKVDGVSNIPKNMALLFKTYKFGPLSGFKRMYVVLLIDLIISMMIFGALDSIFYSGLRTLFGLCAPFVTTLLIMIILYCPLTGLANNLIALFRSYYFLHFNVDSEHSLIDELKVANNKLLKRIDPYYTLDPYNVEDSVIVVNDKNAHKKTVSEEYKPYLDYETSGKEIENVEDDVDDVELDKKETKAQIPTWIKDYVLDGKPKTETTEKKLDDEDLNVLNLMNETENTLDTAQENIDDFSSESDLEIFSNVDHDELIYMKQAKEEESWLASLMVGVTPKQTKALKEANKKNPCKGNEMEGWNDFMSGEAIG